MAEDTNAPDNPQTEHLKPGQIVGSRYQIIELLGVGGMGMVYRATDQELGLDVALKVLRPELLGNATALERMKNELLLARQVSHRNVVRIHDLATDAAGAGLKYISMAFIEGETLRHLIERDGALPMERAIPMMIELCAGLEAAHEVGIVHRDFKPENVIVDKRGQAIITDFGVARGVETVGITRTGAILGTLQYMSPEQACGEKVDQRSDIYSFGLVAYEMLTGRLPHATETTPEFVARALQRKPVDPRQYKPEIPAYLAKIILRCLEVDPGLRYKSARDVAAALEARKDQRAPVYSPAGARRLFGNRRLAYGLILALVVIAGGFLAYQMIPRTTPSKTVGETASFQSSIVVLPFLNRSSDVQLDWLRTGLVELLITDISASKQVRVAGAKETFQLLRDLKVEKETNVSEETMRQVARFLSCDHVLAGSVARAGSELAFDVKLYKASAGGLVLVTTVRNTGAEEKIFAIAAALGAEVRKALDPSLTAAPSQAGMTRSTEAFKSFGLGVEKLQQGEYSKAVDFLEQAVTTDPGFVMAYAKLSEAYYQGGNVDEAKRAYERALGALQGSQGRQLLDSYQIQAQHALLSNDLDSAIKLHTQAAVAYPHNAEIYLALGDAYERKGEPERAIENYEKAIKLEPNNFRVSLGLGKLYLMAGKQDKSVELLGQALVASTQLNNDQGRADVLNAMGIVHQRGQRFDEAERSFLESIAIKNKIGDRRGVAVSLQNAANLYSQQGKFAAAEAKALEALKIFEELDNKPGIADIHYNLGHIYQDTGQFPRALESFRRALTMARGLGNIAFLAQLYERIGQIYYFLGSYSDADTYQRQALAERERIGDEAGVIRSLQSLADVELEQGRLKEALERERKALESSRRLGYSEAAAVSTSQMGLIYHLGGRYKAALESYEEARGIFSKLELKPRLAELEKRTAVLFLELGDLERARQHLKKALESATEVKDQALLSEVSLIEAELSLASGQIESAREALRKALESAEKSGYARALLNAEVSTAALESRHGNKERGVVLMRKHLARAEQLGQAEAIARSYVNLLRSPAQPGSEKQIRQWFDKLREFGLKRPLLQFSILAAAREKKSGRTKQAELFDREAVRLFDEVGSELNGGQRESFRRALER